MKKDFFAQYAELSRKEQLNFYGFWSSGNTSEEELLEKFQANIKSLEQKINSCNAAIEELQKVTNENRLQKVINLMDKMSDEQKNRIKELLA